MALRQRGKQQRSRRKKSSGMKVYFCGSIRGGRDDVTLYRRLVQLLQRYGSVLTEHVSSEQLSDRGQRSHTAARQLMTSCCCVYFTFRRVSC